MIVKGKNEEKEIKGISIISEYKHLGILVDSKMNIKKHISMRAIKMMLKLTLHTNTKRLKLSLGITDIQIPLYKRLVNFKEKYLNTFKEECMNSQTTQAQKD